MNKLTLPCIRAILEVPVRGNWVNLAKLVLIYPAARDYYVAKEGVKTLFWKWPCLKYNVVPEIRETGLSWSRGPVPDHGLNPIIPVGFPVHGFELTYRFYWMVLTLLDRGQNVLCFGLPDSKGLEGAMDRFLDASRALVTLGNGLSIYLDLSSPSQRPHCLRILKANPDSWPFLFRALDLFQAWTNQKFPLLEELSRLAREI